MKTYSETNPLENIVFIEFVIKIIEDCSAADLTPTTTTSIEYMIK